MSFNVSDFMPLDFSQTLDLLANWQGRTVHVTSYSSPPGQPLSHSMTSMAGELGVVQMVDNAIDRNSDSVAAFPVGPTSPNRFYISAGDFVRTQPLPGTDDSVRIDFRHDFSIRVAAE